ncbi:S9 family peptidase [Chakrabartia godavariana]|nr:S9 family peptidase [Chakrabartia godavariana]
MRTHIIAVVSVFLSHPANAQKIEAAAAFGARQSIEDISLSPDGTKIAYVAPAKGQASQLFTIDLNGDGKTYVALTSSGKPDRLGNCGWISNSRLACTVYGVIYADQQKSYFSRLFAVDLDGRNLKMLSSKSAPHSYYGGGILEALKGTAGRVMIARTSQSGGCCDPDYGLGVDDVDSVTLQTKRIVKPIPSASEFISDGNGHVRILGLSDYRAGYDTGVTKYRFRLMDDEKWSYLSDYDFQREAGFNPVVIDAADNSVIGFEKLDGRHAVFRVKLDGSGAKSLVFKHDRVDVDQIRTIGRSRRPVGVSFATDRRQTIYLDKDLETLQAKLTKTLSHIDQVSFLDSSEDESVLLLQASSDTVPGEYYILNRKTNALRPLFSARPELEGYKLASVKSIEVTVADGTKVPAYLTLPPGSTGRNLPALVMPHGGPSARDEWGFDWLAQYFANQGYAVLQPNYRGSSGYGDEWYQENGFRSWKTAIGDVTDSGRWLIQQGIADPKRLAIFGWSYGGYAALQSGVVAPDLFKAIVAVAPVTDLNQLKLEGVGYSNRRLLDDYIGSGPHLREGSPAQNAVQITAPVLIVHGLNDINVNINQSRLMVDRLKDAGKAPEYMEVPDLDHYMEDSAIRRDMLARSSQFLAKRLGL